VESASLKFLAAIVCFLTIAAAAQAQILSATARAKQLIEAGQLGLAEYVLSEQKQDDLEILFLEGQVQTLQEHWAEAENFYRKFLDIKPETPRVRLELARALFEEGDYVASEYQFRFAIAGGLPDTVTQNVNVYLDKIQQRKRWTAEISAGTIADDNMGHSPNISSVTLFGLSFLLSQQAKQKGGFGVTVTASAEYAAPLDERIKLRTGITFDRHDYQNKPFDDMQVQTYIGPQYLGDGWEVSFLAFALDRWFSNDPFYNGPGVRVEANWNVSNHNRLGAYVQSADLWYPRRHFLNGVQIDWAIVDIYAFDAANYVQATLGTGRQYTIDQSFTNSYGRFALGYGGDLPLGITVYAEPSITYFSYDAQTLGQDRRDWFVSTSLIIAKRDWNIFGFKPQSTIGYQHDESTVKLNSFDRKFVQLGLTRKF
jgi:outer membrane protein